MMKQLEFALQGGNTTVNNVENNTAEQAAETTPSEQTTEFSAQPQDKPVEVAAAENQDNTEVNVPSETFKKNDNEEDNESNNSESFKSESPEETSDNGENEEEDDEKKKPVTKNSLHTDEEYDALEQKLTALQTQFNELSQANAALIEFKNQVEDKQKDELIANSGEPVDMHSGSIGGSLICKYTAPSFKTPDRDDMCSQIKFDFYNGDLATISFSAHETQY